MKNYAIILASGNGKRFGANIPKQFVQIAGKTILEHTIEVFEKSAQINEIIIVITPEYKATAAKILAKNNYIKVSKLIDGGKIRKESSFIGINSIEEKEANVLIHDCARPFLTQKIISDCIEALEKYNAVVPAIPTSDTIYEIEENNIINNVPNREILRNAQTPQCFKLSVIKKAHELSKNDTNFTDDCTLVVKHNLAKVFVVNGDTKNIKITYPNDIIIAEIILKNKNK